MKRWPSRLSASLAAVLLVAFCGSASHAAPMTLQQLLMKAGANYRSAPSFRSVSQWTRRVGGKEYRATVTVSALRPNLYRLSAKGAYFDTEVACDGHDLVALRLPRNVFTKRPAPQVLIGADVLEGVTLPTPATRVITLLLEGRWQDRSHPLMMRVLAGELSGPQPFGDISAYVVTFDYDADYTARLYISPNDWVVRRVALYHGGGPEIIETVETTSFKASLDEGAFHIELPPDAIQAKVLPPPDEPVVPKPVTVETIDGRKINLTDLRGSVVLVTFFFTTCPYCNEEVPELQAIYEKLKGKGLEIIAVNGTGETKEEVQRWARERGLSFPVALNKTPTDLVTMFNVKAYPTNVVYNREGKVSYKGEGYDRTALLKALAEAGLQQLP